MSKNDLLNKEHRVDPSENWRIGQIERMAGGDGYDVMAKVEAAEKWKAISSWGSDGWDLGDWPYVVIYVRRHGDAFQIAYYVEGDITVYEYATKEEAFGAVDALAFFHWKHQGSREPDVSEIETVDDMPERFCGPYGQDRAEATA